MPKVTKSNHYNSDLNVCEKIKGSTGGKWKGVHGEKMKGGTGGKWKGVKAENERG